MFHFNINIDSHTSPIGFLLDPDPKAVNRYPGSNLYYNTCGSGSQKFMKKMKQATLELNYKNKNVYFRKYTIHF